MSEGAAHYVGQIPYVIIGSGGGFFKTGRMVTFPNQVPNNHLLTSILHALGMTSVTGVGDPKYAGNIDTALTTVTADRGVTRAGAGLDRSCRSCARCGCGGAAATADRRA